MSHLANSMLDRVREYMKRHPRRGHQDDDELARSLEDLVVAQAVSDLNLYVRGLEGQMIGVSYDVNVAAGLRRAADKASARINDEWLRTKNDRLYWFTEAAAQYIALLESIIAGEQLPSYSSINQAAAQYGRCKRNITTKERT